ncbi:COG1216 Predicted glycosyltransferases [Burkholderiales bacterium]
MNVTITFACYNQSSYTEKCMTSLVAAGTNLDQVVVVDNCSNDDTMEVLQRYPQAHTISNKQNMGCGVAWNQGALLRQTEWTVVMNNDIVVSQNWLTGLVESAERNQLKIACPATVDGSDDYDIQAEALRRGEAAINTVRLGSVHAVCMLIHSSVWKDVGYFRATPKLLGYEDTIFFDECQKAGIPMGTVGSSWIHHYGSITQDAMRKERGLTKKAGLGDRHNYRLLNKSLWERKLDKYKKLKALKRYENEELSSLGFSLHGHKKPNEPINWRIYN